MVRLRSYRAAVAPFAFAIAALVPMCGPSPPRTPDGPTEPIAVNGTEHLEWDQSSVDGGFPQYDYVSYVDDVRGSLAADCQPSASNAGTAHCRAPLPQMTAGSHRLELASVRTVLGISYESARSAPIALIVSATSLAAQRAQVSSVASAKAASAVTDSVQSRGAGDRALFTIETLAATLAMPSAVAPLPDGRVLIAEASGAIRMWDSRSLALGTAARIDEVARAGDVGLIGMTLHPRFKTNHEVFVVYAAREADGSLVNRVARLRESAGILGEAIVILEDRIRELPQRTPRIRFGTDGKLYVAFPAGRDRREAEDPALYVGKILRVNEDGTTPVDNPGFSPVISAGDRSPAPFDWQPASGELWFAERDWSGRDVLRTGTRPGRTAFQFESVIDPANVVFYKASALGALDGSLLIAALDGRQLRRVLFDANDPRRVAGTDSLVGDQFGRIADVAEGPAGEIYFCTSNGQSGMPAGIDRLVRISAAAGAPR